MDGVYSKFYPVSLLQMDRNQEYFDALKEWGKSKSNEWRGIFNRVSKREKCTEFVPTHHQASLFFLTSTMIGSMLEIV